MGICIGRTIWKHELRSAVRHHSSPSRSPKSGSHGSAEQESVARPLIRFREHSARIDRIRIHRRADHYHI